MTTCHRYIILDAKYTTLNELHKAIRENNGHISFDHESVLRDGIDCGILIDVTVQGEPVFDDDLTLVTERLTSSSNDDRRTLELIRSSRCMVTTHVSHYADESVLEAIWSTLRSYCPGILAMEDYAWTIRYYD